MNTNPLISIIIPCYNKAKYLKATLDSALSQTYENTEIIVVDDGSTDNPDFIMQQYSDSKIKYFKQKNSGVVVSRNRAIENSQGQWILPLDADDILPDNYIETLWKNVDDIKTISSAPHIYVDENCKSLNTVWPELTSRADFSFEALFESNRISNSSLYSRQMWEAVGGYDIKVNNLFCEDWELWINLVYHGCKIKFTRDTAYYYRILPWSGKDVSRTNLDSIKWYLWKKYKLKTWR